MKPLNGSGAGVGIEDAATLGILLGSVDDVRNLEGRLAMYNELRYSRGVTIKYASATPLVSHEPIEQLKRLTGHGIPENVPPFIMDEDVEGEAIEAPKRL